MSDSSSNWHGNFAIKMIAVKPFSFCTSLKSIDKINMKIAFLFCNIIDIISVFKLTMLISSWQKWIIILCCLLTDIDGYFVRRAWDFFCFQCTTNCATRKENCLRKNVSYLFNMKVMKSNELAKSKLHRDKVVLH